MILKCAGPNAVGIRGVALSPTLSPAQRAICTLLYKASHRDCAAEHLLHLWRKYPPPSTRNLGRGIRLAAHGQVQDTVGRPKDATVRVFRGDEEIGYATTTVGRFSLFDLRDGEYQLQATTARGSSPKRTFEIRPGIPRITVVAP